MTRYQRVLLVLLLLAGMWGAFAGDAVYAQSVPGAADPVEDVTSAPSMTWKEIVNNGGKLMYVLGAMSVLTVAFVVYFFAVLRVAQVAPRPLHRELVEKIGAGAFDAARRACEYRACPLSAVALSAIDYVRDVPQADPMLVKDVVEGEGGRQAENIQGQTQYLLDIAAVSPMVGLLGTVFGMLRAFSSVALDIASAKPVNLAAGVSQALITTAFGLIIGIPAMVFYAYFRRRAAKIVSQLEVASTDVLSALMAKGRASDEPRELA